MWPRSGAPTDSRWAPWVCESTVGHLPTPACPPSHPRPWLPVSRDLSACVSRCPASLRAVCSLSSKDQDKTRPLSTLANLAIIITDVQDMDPIFINLPYSTNIYEHSPPVRAGPCCPGVPSCVPSGLGGPCAAVRGAQALQPLPLSSPPTPPP